MQREKHTDEDDIRFWTTLEVVSLCLVVVIGIAMLFQWVSTLLGLALLAPVVIFLCMVLLGHRINDDPSRF